MIDQLPPDMINKINEKINEFKSTMPFVANSATVQSWKADLVDTRNLKTYYFAVN
jgi:hypothetical protein